MCQVHTSGYLIRRCGASTCAWALMARHIVRKNIQLQDYEATVSGAWHTVQGKNGCNYRQEGSAHGRELRTSCSLDRRAIRKNGPATSTHRGHSKPMRRGDRLCYRSTGTEPQRNEGIRDG